MTTPVIAGPTVVWVGSTVTLTAAASSLLAGGSVSSFTWVKPGNVPEVVPAVNGESSVSFTANGNDNDALTTTVYAKDNAGNKSQVTSHVVTLNLIVIPDVANMTTNIPSTIAAGESVGQLSITGATDPDGGSVTYSLTLPAGVTASKANGLTSGESFSITAATNATVNPTADAIITVTASGGRTKQVVRSLAVTAAKVPSAAHELTGSGTLTIPAGVTRITATGNGSAGGTTTTTPYAGEATVFKRDGGSAIEFPGAGSGDSSTPDRETLALTYRGAGGVINYTVPSGGYLKIEW